MLRGKDVGDVPPEELAGHLERERIRVANAEDQEQVDKLLEKVVAEMKSRISARLHKETQRRKNALETSTLPPKLRDCRSTEVEATELFIVEGDSAGGSAKQGRDRKFQAILPLRGKVLNVEKARVEKLLENKEITSLIAALAQGKPVVTTTALPGAGPWLQAPDGHPAALRSPG